MDPENNVLTFLKRFRYLTLALMVVASLVNAFVRFAGDWSHFWGALAVQAWFMQAVFAYLRGGWVTLGPGGLSKDANPLGRAALAATAFAFYLLTFAFGVEKHTDSIYERRASDWTMPTREEIGHRTE
ncbi:hypothetical protein [Pseudomonas putida]|uniref:hypothetical protein n=1 Tax=Pseudomonas putida TaxID=303 RepID=UPI003D990EBD